MTGQEDALLKVEHLKMHFPIRRGFFQRVSGHIRAVDDVNLTVLPGETLGLVGESGCGKTTLGRCIVRSYQPTAGSIHYAPATRNGNALPPVDLTTLTRRELKPYYRQIRMIFQDPFASLNPRLTVFDNVAEPLRIHKIAEGNDLEQRVAGLLQRVGLPPEFMRRYPHAFSGGQRQRIGIARALALEPRMIVADEAVSALDVSVRAQILNLLLELQREMGLTYLFISHDLSVVEYIAHRVAVMYVGKVVEIAPSKPLFAQPQHPYTEALLSAIPRPNPRRKTNRIILEGDVADPSNPPSGCYFHPRCRHARARCKTERPELRDVGGGHLAACHFSEELNLLGI